MSQTSTDRRMTAADYVARILRDVPPPTREQVEAVRRVFRTA